VQCHPPPLRLHPHKAREERQGGEELRAPHSTGGEEGPVKEQGRGGEVSKCAELIVSIDD